MATVLERLEKLERDLSTCTEGHDRATLRIEQLEEQVGVSRKGKTENNEDPDAEDDVFFQSQETENRKGYYIASRPKTAKGEQLFYSGVGNGRDVDSWTDEKQRMFWYTDRQYAKSVADSLKVLNKKQMRPSVGKKPANIPPICRNVCTQEVEESNS